MQKKKANIVFPTGDFITNLVLETARRVIRNGERVEYLIEEYKLRFPNITNEQIYTLLVELTKLGFDISPNEWILYTPIENRANILNKYIIKKGKSYGSRTEDIKSCIKDKQEELRKINTWLKENQDAARLSPQTYIRYMELKKYFENRIEELKNLLKLVKAMKSDLLFKKSSRNPFKYIGFNEDDNLSVILYGVKDGNIYKAAVNELTVDVDKDFKEDESDIPLKTQFDQLIKSGDPLRTFANTFTKIYESESDTTVKDYIIDFLEHMDMEKDSYIESKTFTPEEINDAFKKIKEFVKMNNLDIDVDKFIDKSLEFEEKEPEEIKDIDEVEKEKPLPEESIAKAAADKMDIRIADSLVFLNKIQSIINDFKTSEVLNRTAELDTALSSLEDKIKNLKFFIREELPYYSDKDKEAAYVIIAHIVHDLNKFKDLTKNDFKNTEVRIVSSQILLNKIKHASLLISSIWE